MSDFQDFCQDWLDDHDGEAVVLVITLSKGDHISLTAYSAEGYEEKAVNLMSKTGKGLFPEAWFGGDPKKVH